MSSIGYINLSDRAATGLGWGGSLVAVTGVVVAIFSEMITNATGCPASAYIWGPATGVSVLGLAALVIACLRKETIEPPQQPVALPPSPGRSDAAASGAGAQNPSSSGTAGASSSGTGTNASSTAATGSNPSSGTGDSSTSGTAGASSSGTGTNASSTAATGGQSSSGTGGSSTSGAAAPGTQEASLTDLERACRASLKEGLAPPLNAADYKLQVGVYTGLKPADMVLAPMTVKTAFDFFETHFPDKKVDLEQQCASLDADYYYQVVQGMGDCFFISLTSGLVHHMLTSPESKTALINTINGLKDYTHKKEVLASLEAIHDRASLTDFLLNKEKVEHFVGFLRAIAADKTGRPNVATLAKHATNPTADEHTIEALRAIFKCGICIGAMQNHYPFFRETLGKYADPFDFLILHNKTKGDDHFDLLIPKATLAAIPGMIV